ncbi:hypothetical protein CF165_12015 [Amycolatopsis vastitatis]|uniref:DUF6879 domain-containing protein n=2 Tax=Amycolatopsis vastitatis TaxID=1905142 RepID=A0A229TDI1_9PSEU|nr:hypothetical protein CF165_12015 [Amycolatopsis vastitatis]
MRLGAEWMRYFDEFTLSAFRLEMQQTYTIPAERSNVELFLAGGERPLGHNAAWRGRIEEIVASGRTVQRAKAVRRPLTDYLRYQCAWSIPGNVAAGEDYRMVDITENDRDLPEQDFWLFDEVMVVHLDYNPDGTFVGAELVEEPDLAQYRRWREVALSHGVAFGEWDAGAGPAG